MKLLLTFALDPVKLNQNESFSPHAAENLLPKMVDLYLTETVILVC